MTNKMAAEVLTYELGSLSYAKLWGFKALTVDELEEDDRLAIFKPGLWRLGFLNAAKNGTISAATNGAVLFPLLFNSMRLSL